MIDILFVNGGLIRGVFGSCVSLGAVEVRLFLFKLTVNIVYFIFSSYGLRQTILSGMFQFLSDYPVSCGLECSPLSAFQSIEVELLVLC